MVMKRIEAFITSEKTSAVLSALEDRGFQATFYESKGMGKGEKYTISYAKGGGTQKMPYSTRSIVVSIVDENKVKETVSAIKEAAKTGTTSAGIVVVSSIDDVVIIWIMGNRHRIIIQTVLYPVFWLLISPYHQKHASVSNK